MPTLVGVAGVLFMALYISIITAVLAPLQCFSNPNGMSTVRCYSSIICWHGSEHSIMVAMGLVGMDMPLTFLVYCTYLVRHRSLT